MPEQLPRVVIVGGGFGGVAAAKALRKAPVEVILIDRNNHHVFMPLLYQVATAVLAPGQVGYPIRGIVGRQESTTVILGEATGVSHSYYGHDEFAPFAPGLKTLAHAVAVRNRVLQAFEQAEAEEDPSRHRDLLTFVLV